MPTTTYGLFATVAQTGTTTTWSDLNNIKAEPGLAIANLTSFNRTNVAEISDPVSGSEIPGLATILEISIQINARITVNTFGGGRARINIDDSGDILEDLSTTLETHTVSGDLAFWGLNQTQARAFANGTVDLNIYMQETTPEVDEFQWAWVKVQFTYEGGLIAPAILF